MANKIIVAPLALLLMSSLALAQSLREDFADIRDPDAAIERLKTLNASDTFVLHLEDMGKHGQQVTIYDAEGGSLWMTKDCAVNSNAKGWLIGCIGSKRIPLDFTHGGWLAAAANAMRIARDFEADTLWITVSTENGKVSLRSCSGQHKQLALAHGLHVVRLR